MDDPKMVPEQDLIALKQSHSEALGKLQTDHTGALDALKQEHTGKSSGFQSQINTAQEELSRLRAANAQFEEAGRNHATTAEEMAGLKTELKQARDGLKTAEDSLSKNLRDHLMIEFRIPGSALDGKTVAELTTIRDALLATRSPESRQYTAGGGTGGEPPQRPREKIKAGLEGGDLKPM